jgi:hypothetical protein
MGESEVEWALFSRVNGTPTALSGDDVLYDQITDNFSG